MKVLMISWEYPPYLVGGLGTHCAGLTKELKNNVDLSFVVPFKFKIKKPRHMKVIEIDILKPKLKKSTNRCTGIYEKTQKRDMTEYAKCVAKIAKENNFDLIHCQDWMTLEAGIAAKEATGKPLIATCHSLAIDTAKKPKKYRLKKERIGFAAVDKIIAVSKYTKKEIIRFYKIPEKKITVVYNAISQTKKKLPKKVIKKRILYAGRLTYQKGITYFLEAASLVLVKDSDVRFIIVGHGKKKEELKTKAKELGIEHAVKFAGYVKDLNKSYRDADIFVMPSVSEPFGLTPLESIKNGTPTIISKQSGISEILKNTKKIDYWDVKKLASTINNLLSDKKAYNSLRRKSYQEIKEFTWKNVAKNTTKVYKK
jgi:glycosyltransferase involved in cell wall biosynthesis